MTWAIEKPEWIQITVTSGPEQKTEVDHRRELLFAQQFRGDPAELVRERRGTVSDRDWLVLEFRNPNTRPPRSEIHYFLQTSDGCVTLFLVCEEADFAEHRDATESFLGEIQVK
ncbi:hypothetical protein ElP_27130 [Tautonia plasticadhaerens]|uniref:Uncharacterized protein n=2 Tax=Tautonia plasticadhaerens TaxID=2527974 RepID=A0A518H1U9_9BACT|nr:hypothetical protein ElP_27130 [Tautonia plasticadhaerens]